MGTWFFQLELEGHLLAGEKFAAKEKQLKVDSLKGENETGNWFNFIAEFTDKWALH